MKKFILLVALCAIVAGVSAQGHHPAAGHQQPPVERHHGNDRHIDRHNHHHATPPAPLPPCATPEQMQLVIKTLKAQSFDENKLEIAKLCVTIGLFCTDDLARMAAEMTFDDSRLAFLIYAHPYCTDRERYPTLRDCFTFSLNFDKLMETVYPQR